MSSTPILGVDPLSFPWQTQDPFLFCVHHLDQYPAGTAEMAPAASLAGRALGQDFSGKDGWSMYHGQTVPGFPRHPHRGFETVTIARQGYIDHSDSLGATARFGQGDVQWMTAGRGVEHCEMFPLVNQEAANPTELFQIWLNLPSKDKLVDPHFAMLWNHTIPVVSHRDASGNGTEVSVVAGQLGDAKAPPSPPSSWAADPQNHVAIWTLKLDANATFTVPAAVAGLNRALYLFAGDGTKVAGQAIQPRVRIRLVSDQEVVLENGPAPAELLLLQGRPIGETVAQHGPFVMNTPAQIQQAFMEYQRGSFGRWPWPSDAPAHGREAGRFAIHADGRRDAPAVE